MVLGRDSRQVGLTVDLAGRRTTRAWHRRPSPARSVNDGERPARPAQDVEEHLIVVAQDRDQRALPLQLDQAIEHAPAVRAAVDVVAQGDDHVVGARLDRREQRLPGRASIRGYRRWRSFEAA